MAIDDTAIPEGHKYCSGCDQWKPHSEFFRCAKRRDGLQYNCKNCSAKIKRGFRARYPDKKREENRRYRAAHKSDLKKYKYPSQPRSPEQEREHKRRRWSHKANLPCAFTAADEARALNYWHGCCAVCGRPLRDLFGERFPAMDHWIPLSDSRPDNPGTVPWNMVPLCHGKGGCNNRKNDSNPLEWLAREYNPKKVRQIRQRIEAFFEWVKHQ